MQRVLRKRVFRNLRKHFVRYFMLGIMIAMGIFLVVTIVGSGETLSRGTVDLAEETNLEDGEFEVFLPLSGFKGTKRASAPAADPQFNCNRKKTCIAVHAKQHGFGTAPVHAHG